MLIAVGKSSSKWWRLVCDAELGLFAERTCGGFGHEHILIMRSRLCSFRWVWITRVIVMLGWMWVRAFDLHKTFRANRLITAPSLVEIRGIVEETDGTFRGVFV